MKWEIEFDKEFVRPSSYPDLFIINTENPEDIKAFIKQQLEKIIEEVEDFDADNNHKLVKQLRKEFGL